jgi:hypothetical protein
MGVILSGDKSNPEPGTFVVEFPGGHVEISRLGDGTDGYWCHFTRNREDDCIAASKLPGELIDGRVDVEGRHASDCDAGDMDHKDVFHVAVKIRVKRGTKTGN